ncbi:MAG: ABC transporter substrate-binding protein [Caldimonas sp.]
MNDPVANHPAAHRCPAPRRRKVIASFCLTVLGVGSNARAGGSMPKRVGVLFQGSRGPDAESSEANFVEVMAEQGSKVGRDFVLVRAYCDSRLDHVRGAVDELIRQRVDVIVLTTTDDMNVEAARVTRAVPMVFAQSFAPLELGLVDSYAKPGRNLTGTTVYAGPGIQNKRIEYLRAIAPAATRLFWLWGTGSASMPTVRGPTYEVGKTIESDAATMGITARVYVIRHSSEMPTALAEAAAWNAHALSGGGEPVYEARRELINFAARARLPSVFSVNNYVRDGGLLSYGVPDDESSALYGRFVSQIQRVLGGVPVETIPVELPRRHNLLINLKTARSLGLTVPATMLARADELIEK